MSFTITAIDSATSQSLRMTPSRQVVLDQPGAPCRQCLQPGRTGDRMLLVGYQPFAGDGPYCVPTPIYLHAQPCPTYAPTDQIPPVVSPGLRSVRAYDDNDDLLDGVVVAGLEVEAVIPELFADDRVAYLHVYSATHGCFTCRVDRVTSDRRVGQRPDDVSAT